MTRRPARRRVRRPRRRSRSARRRLTVAVVAALVAAGAGVALLVQVSRPPQPQPFHFPPALVATPTVEITAEERARLQQVLDQLRATPTINGSAARR